eukprot:SAG11_NODE_2886_length_2867_cov_1.874277_2_plen_61_part_00
MRIKLATGASAVAFFPTPDCPGVSLFADGADERITRLVDQMDLSFNIVANPDGVLGPLHA